MPSVSDDLDHNRSSMMTYESNKRDEIYEKTMARIDALEKQELYPIRRTNVANEIN